MEITVSYSRKLNHQLYGGNSYESSDFFVSLKNEIDDETDPKQAHNELSQLAEDLVDTRVEEQIVGFQGGIPFEEYAKFIYDYAANRLKDPEVFDNTRKRMSKFQRHIVDSMRRGRAIAKSDALKEAKNIVYDND